jgi:hypothetical protein
MTKTREKKVSRTTRIMTARTALDSVVFLRVVIAARDVGSDRLVVVVDEGLVDEGVVAGGTVTEGVVAEETEVVKVNDE